jgi:hypothetical protein
VERHGLTGEASQPIAQEPVKSQGNRQTSDNYRAKIEEDDVDYCDESLAEQGIESSHESAVTLTSRRRLGSGLQLEDTPAGSQRSSGLSTMSVEDSKITKLYPLALWVPDEDGSGKLRTGNDIPADLEEYLCGELFSHVKIKGRANRWLKMEANNAGCILTWVIGKKYTSHFAATRRACMTCTAQGSGRKAERRPCALLEKVGSQLMVVFLSLEEKLRAGVEWQARKFWVA